MHIKPMNRTALITGASSGIGYELARVFVERGYDVVLVARRVERLEQIKLELLELRSEAKVWCVPVDLSKPRGAKKVLSATEELGIQVDTLVNNAGAAWQGA